MNCGKRPAVAGIIDGPATERPLATDSADLFGTRRFLPKGFRYAQGLIEPVDEAALLQAFQSLPFKEFEFHGFAGKRRVVSFGWRYDFNGGGLQKTEDIPPFLRELRAKAAGFAEVGPSDLQQVLVTEYRPGAAIGWHKDRFICCAAHRAARGNIVSPP
jgi:alkylated DNA repair dioxygenase AlkB